jgi:hypothetical protein
LHILAASIPETDYLCPMIEKRWIHYPPFTSEQEQVAQRLAESLKVSPSLATLLVQRGIFDFDQSRDFFRPDIKYLHDPFLMADMERATERLIKAIDSNEKILVYGDYDVDGTTSVALFYGFLKEFTQILTTTFPIATRKATAFRGRVWNGPGPTAIH